MHPYLLLKLNIIIKYFLHILWIVQIMTSEIKKKFASFCNELRVLFFTILISKHLNSLKVNKIYMLENF